MAIFKASASIRVILNSQFRPLFLANGFKSDSGSSDSMFKQSDDFETVSDDFVKPVRGFEKTIKSPDKSENSLQQLINNSTKRSDEFDRPSAGFEKYADGFDRRPDRYGRRSEGYENQSNGYERRSGGFERRSEGFERRSDGFERRSDGFERRSNRFDRRSEGFDRAEDFNGRRKFNDRGYEGFGRQPGVSSRKSNGVISESEWFAKRDRPMNAIKKVSGAQIYDQPVSLECENVEFNTWNKFSEIENLDSRLLDVIVNIGHNEMTPIQKNTFDILNRRLIDILGSAETGSGKTLAFLLPILNNILSNFPNAMMEDLKKTSIQMPLMLVMAPTRELVQQIYHEARMLLQLTPISVRDVIGGINIESQMRNIDYGCHALIATPGRLIDLVSRGALSLKYCNNLVLDEADRMLDMGFEPQITQIISDFDMPKKETRQTSMFSATFPSDVMNLARKLMNVRYGRVLVGSDAGSRDPTIPKLIKQSIILCTESTIFTELFKLLEDSTKKTIVFCNTKRDVALLERFAMKRQINVTTLYGDLSQRQRDEQMNAFKKNQALVLIATSVAARGIDVADVERVVNYGAPTNAEEYVHRVGRCGRMGREGEAICLVTKQQLDVGTTSRDLAQILQKTGQEVPDFMLNKRQGNGARKLGTRGKYNEMYFS